jgi:hypothetical protein
MAKKAPTGTTTEALPSEQIQVVEQPAEGGSYTRCPDSGELTLVARTSHEAPSDDDVIDFDTPTDTQA